MATPKQVLSAPSAGAETRAPAGTPQDAPRPTNVDEAGLAELFARAESAQAAATASESDTATAAGQDGQTDTESDATETPRPGEAEAADAQDEGNAAPASEEEAADAEHTEETQAEDEEAETEEAAEADESEPAGAKGKGIRRLLRQNAMLKAELARLKGQAKPDQDAQPAPPVETFDDHPEMQRIGAEMAKTDAILRWLEENPDGGELHGMRVPADQVEKLIAVAKERQADARFEQRALRREWAQTAERRRVEIQAQSQQLYPRLFQAETLEHKTAVEILAQLPASARASLQRLPEANLLLGDLVAGRLARQKAKANPLTPSNGSRTTPPRVTVGRGSAPVKAPAAGQNGELRREFEAAVAAFHKSGSVDDLARVDSLREQLREAAVRR